MKEFELPRGEACEPGIIVIDKPRGLTSNQVLSRVRRLAGQKKVGYAGTLDPMATGLLIFAVGKATKLLQYLTAHDKAYLARVRFGMATDTDDAEGAVTSALGAEGLTIERVESELAAYRGEIQQVPSTYSAIKVDGKRAYDLARRGEEVELKARTVTISKLELLPFWPVPNGKNLPTGTGQNGKNEGSVAQRSTDSPVTLDVDLLVECSAGTYVRALARDLGRDLGCGAHLTALRRIRVGDYALDSAKTLDDLAAEVEKNGKIQVKTLDEALLSTFPPLEVDETQARALSFGQSIRISNPPQITDNERGQRFAAHAPLGSVVALVEMATNPVDDLGEEDTTPKSKPANQEAKTAKPVWVLHPHGSQNHE
ncbi:MAG: tRNA pseudouridine(55) synthase TruB [Mobiluncus porci]|uniref:tRNA pseudouridine(55) synthase TruB n=1 Tax=Mobiluncus porci TaxID=2652278 RepID=UPI0023F06E6A|nr:tRNA pseudouridine(55) synthase TruB [Mobiluncus porci]MDD7540735.1 tRNA pseudouridine(55) synthase TruB [Mobiluncus porci]MDY5748297.1 tRNA pseudouridine(55) synthase TruB [Mobiluncus porci]